MKCVTCSQPLPKEMKQHPGYLAQHGLKTEPDDVQDFVQEATTILRYLKALGWALMDADGMDDNDLYWLHQLTEDLSAEALRRLAKANGALDRQYERERERKVVGAELLVVLRRDREKLH